MKKLVLIIAVCTVFSSCGEWLDLEPENDQISANYWQNKEEVEAVLGAAYVTFRNNVETILAWGEARGGALAVFSTDESLSDIYRWNITPDNDLCNWSSFYQVINYCNSVIFYGPDVVKKDESFDENVMNSLLSEAYFLRAMTYFYLVRSFREVPLITSPYINDEQEYEIPKSAEAAIYNQITKDLVRAKGTAKEVFPELWQTKGRSTLWAVKAALADVYLWKGEYDSAIFELDDVINSGRVGLIQGEDRNGENLWFTIFSEGNSNESIFEVQYDYDENETNGLYGLFSGAIPDYALGENLFFLFQSEPDDIRAEGATYLASGAIWKYLGGDAGGVVPRERSDQNFIIYRMAEIYLMKAEALAMKGNFEAATEAVNLVRERAGIETPIQAPGSELEMLGLVMDEKAREFVGEGKRWFDLLRVGKRNNYEYKDYMSAEVLKGAPASTSALIQSKLFDVDSYFLPIHFDELQANRKLVQNPYYDALN